MDGPDEYIAKLEKQYQQELQDLKDKYTNLLKQYLTPLDDDAEPIHLTSDEEEEPRYLTRHQKRKKEEKENPRYTDLDDDFELPDEGSIESMSNYAIKSYYHDDEEEGDDCGEPEVFEGDAGQLSLLLACIKRAGYLHASVHDLWYMRTFGDKLKTIKNNLGNQSRNAIARQCWDNIISSCFRRKYVTQKAEDGDVNRTTCGFCGEVRDCTTVFTVLRTDYHMGKYCLALANAVLSYYTKFFSLRNRKITTEDMRELGSLMDAISQRQEEKASKFKKNEH
jgi:hypothetical protein